ncbi:MAG: DNA polymerase I [Clostridiales bacterium]|nr:DNA polymerase I [Clostridiales bacterium]
MSKLVLIDGNSLFNRAFYATPVFTTKDGTPTNAIFGFTKLLFKILSDEKPEYILVAFDMKAPTFRHKMYDGYKGTRKPMPDDLAVQVEPLKNLLKAMKIAIYQQEGIEADDILGTMSAKFDVHSLLFTGDRDSYQLVNEKTDVCFTKKGVSDIYRLTYKNFVAEIGLEPRRIIDLKALMGDKSDNIPGVPGIGEKTALDLLSKYASLDGIYEHIDELKGSLKEKFLNNKELAYLSYNLAKIDRNCDISIKLEDCIAPQKFDSEVKRIFTELEFRSFLGLDIFTEDIPQAHSEIVYPEKIECKNLSQISDDLENSSVFAVELTKSGAEIYCGGKQYSIKSTEDLFALDGMSRAEFDSVLCEIYGKKSNRVIAFDSKAQMHALSEMGIDFCCEFDDLSLAKYLCDYNTGSFNLGELCDYYLYDRQFGAFALHGLFNLFSKKLEDEGVAKLYNELEKPLVKVLFKMEKSGMKVSLAEMDNLAKHYAVLLEEYKNKIFSACGCEFNINSPAQLGKVLYEKLGINEVFKKKTGKYSTGAEILEKLTDKYSVVGDILNFRMYQKLNSTYIEGFRPLVDKKSEVVHTTFRQTVTATGRLSSSEPNLQNIPIREDEGRELRKMFVPREGNIFIDADYSQIELRLLAHFSQCKELIEAYNSGIDIHSVTASQVFGVPLSEVTSKMRREAKAVNFGIIYGISDFGLSKNLNIPVSTAREYIEKYFATYSAVKDYMQSNVDFARKHGFVCTLTGRKRVISEINSSNYNLRQFGERAAMNMPLQGSSADIIKIAMINVSKALEKEHLKTKMILQVHDELVLEAPLSEVERASQILKYEMENAVKLKVPLTVDVHTGKNWYDAK